MDQQSFEVLLQSPKKLERNSEQIMAVDLKGRKLLRMNIEGRFFCRYIFDVPKKKFEDQDEDAEESKKNLEAKKIQKMRGSFESLKIIKEIKVVQIGRSISILQQDYEIVLSKISTSLLSYSWKLKIFQNIVEGLIELRKGEILHMNLAPLWIGLQRDITSGIKAKIILHQNSLCSEYFNILLRDKERINIELNSYSAPQVRYCSSITYESDVWSVGAIFFQMMFGSVRPITVSEDSVKIQFPEETPCWLKAFFTKILSFNPKERHLPHEILDFIKPAKKCEDITAKYLPEVKPKKSL